MVKHIIVIFCILLSTQDIVLANDNEIVFTVESFHSTFMECEPIALVLRFYNHGEKAIRISLGTEGISNVKLNIFGGGIKGEAIRGPEYPPGVHDIITIDLQQKQEYRQIILLNDFVGFDSMNINKEGEYKIRVTAGDVNSILVADALVKVVSTNDDLLEEKLIQLWDKYKNPNCPDKERSIIERMFCLTRHKAALKYQMEIISKISAGSLEPFDSAVKSMINTNSTEAIIFLIKNVVEKRGVESSDSQVIFYYLKIYGINNFDKETYKIIEPYKNEIERAILIGVGD